MKYMLRLDTRYGPPKKVSTESVKEFLPPEKKKRIRMEGCA